MSAPEREDGHLSDQQLFDLAAGEPAAEPVQAHLRDCPACRAAVDEQSSVTGRLRALGDQEPMPADLAARLDAAFGVTPARADGLSEEAAEEAPARPVRDVLPIGPAQERRDSALARLAQSRVAKAVVGVAAAGVIAVGGYAALHTNTSTSGGGSAASAGSADSAATPASQAGAGVAGAAGRVVASGFAYTKANVAGEVDTLLSGSDGATSLKAPRATTESQTTLTTSAGLSRCLQALEEPNAVPTLVDVATFDGKPAAVVVLPGDNGSGRQIWVVSPTCAPNQDGVLFYTAVP